MVINLNGTDVRPMVSTRIVVPHVAVFVIDVHAVIMATIRFATGPSVKCQFLSVRPAIIVVAVVSPADVDIVMVIY